MAGHSQFKNIMHRKGKQDKERSKIFAKLSRELTVAAKSGLPDPAHNPRLRSAIIAAKQESMPKDNIERAIQKAVGGSGEAPGDGSGAVAMPRLACRGWSNPCRMPVPGRGGARYNPTWRRGAGRRPPSP